MSQEQMNQVLDESVRLALTLLKEQGEFYPFGVARNTKGEINLVQAKLEIDQPTSDQVIDKLVSGMAQSASQGMYTTAAIVSDVRVRHPETGQFTDALHIKLEDHAAEPVSFFLPYRRLPAGDMVTDNILAQEATQVIFPPRPRK